VSIIVGGRIRHPMGHIPIWGPQPCLRGKILKIRWGFGAFLVFGRERERALSLSIYLSIVCIYLSIIVDLNGDRKGHAS
jgi:hypothetical protein